MKALVGTFNQEKALVGAFSVITNLRMELFEALVREVRGKSVAHLVVRHLGAVGSVLGEHREGVQVEREALRVGQVPVEHIQLGVAQRVYQRLDHVH